MARELDLDGTGLDGGDTRAEMILREFILETGLREPLRRSGKATIKGEGSLGGTDRETEVA